MKRTIFFKIFSGYLVITAALSVLVVFFVFSTIDNHYKKELSGHLVKSAFLMKPEAARLINRGEINGLNDYFTEAAEKLGGRVTFIAPDGEVIADSERDPEGMGNHKNRPEVIKAYSGKEGVSARYSTTVKKEMLYAAVPVDAENGRYVLRLSFFVDYVESMMGGLIAKITVSVFAVICAALVAAYFLAKKISGPLRELREGARKLAVQDFDVSIDIHTKDEVEELAESFNYMAGEIKGLFRDLTARTKQINTIISSMKEGLLVVDSKGRVEMCNESFRKFLGIDFSGSKFYWECMFPPKITELIEKAGREKTAVSGQVEINEKIYLCSITYLAITGEEVLILYDVTGIKEFESIKKDFVANVSHELKTPLTAIKGFAETLDSELVDKDNKHYLEIIRRHTERLINIVEDLLLLSNLEKKGSDGDFTIVDISEVIRSSVKIFEQKVKKKKITLDVEAAPIRIKGDAFKLEQLMINLLDNAVKYTDEGGIKVKAEEKQGSAVLTVEDTGTGIEEEQLPRIFERFYVTDKSRSRKMGGTGLGLSIVKHIVMLHKGNIDVESEKDKGTNFIITLPLA